jgi:hypothetical protein
MSVTLPSYYFFKIISGMMAQVTTALAAAGIAICSCVVSG